MAEQKENFFQIIDNFKEHTQSPSIALLSSSYNFIPKVTVAITTYKRADLLKISLDSVINQVDYALHEVIVVDDDPTTGTETEKLIAEQYQDCKILTYYKNSANLGLFGNWNRCIELAKTEYLTILNDDDYLDVHYLKTTMAVVEKNRNIDMLFVGITTIKNNQIQQNFDVPGRIYKVFNLEFLFGTINPGSLGVLLKTKKAREIGGFNNKFFPTADVVFLVNYLAKSAGAYRLTDKLAFYRLSVNESLKTSVQITNIKNDKLLRDALIEKNILTNVLFKASIPVLDYNHYKRVCDFSKEFNNLYGEKLAELEKAIGLKNRTSFALLEFTRKILLRSSQLTTTNI